ncbi:GNAT family N-acetyltransferase [Butyrivibrio sp. ob235]|uniref:GNAT family N-acetyltransferase n=1 Tax=Butyrivibrio sp. ob235 TaxID=1761780 RepID=UPI001FA6BD2D|nr:GNAT family N-acetyltransferase [Butyrivibrio sp. ob235]
MEIYLIKNDSQLWEKTIGFARECSWRAGMALADKMEKNDFQDWERVIVAVDNDSIAGYCTIAEKDELPDDYSYSPFIGFMFVDEKYRGKRISEQMINCATDYAKGLGYNKVFIMSGEHGLYEKYGFEKLGDFETIYGETDQLFEKVL